MQGFTLLTLDIKWYESYRHLSLHVEGLGPYLWYGCDSFLIGIYPSDYRTFSILRLYGSIEDIDQRLICGSGSFPWWWFSWNFRTFFQLFYIWGVPWATMGIHTSLESSWHQLKFIFYEGNWYLQRIKSNEPKSKMHQKLAKPNWVWTHCWVSRGPRPHA